MSKTIGIDLGTTNSLVATVDSGLPYVIADADGHRIGEVRQLRLVELEEHLRSDLALQEVAGRHHDVVARLAR